MAPLASYVVHVWLLSAVWTFCNFKHQHTGHSCTHSLIKALTVALHDRAEAQCAMGVSFQVPECSLGVHFWSDVATGLNFHLDSVQNRSTVSYLISVLYRGLGTAYMTRVLSSTLPSFPSHDTQPQHTEKIMTTPIPSPPAIPFLGHITVVDRNFPTKSFDLLAHRYGEIHELKILSGGHIFTDHAS